MKKIVHKLRQKSEEEKTHILNVTLFVLSLILLFLWILSLGVDISSKNTKKKIKQDLKPFSILKDSMVGDNINNEE